jgi:hypothetical protein
MADLVLSVDVTSLADARKKLDGLQKAMNGLSVNQLASGVANLQGKIKQLVEAQAKGNIGASAYNKGLLQLKRAYEQLGYSSQQATAAVRQYAAQLQRQRAAQEAARAAEELARAQAQVAARTRELRLRFQEGYAAFDRARQQMRDLREAMRQGIITQDQYKEAVRRLREEQQRASAGAGGLARGINRTGVLTQQAGYQLGDFIVQVQSGTNAFVAFGQQATQVAGTLTLLGGKWILIGSVLGVAIPLLTALGAAYMRTNGAGQTLDQTLSKLKESFSELSENMGMVDDVELDVRFGNLTTEIRNLASAMVELNAASELNNLTNVLDKLESSATGNFGQVALESILQTFVPGYATRADQASPVSRANAAAFANLNLPMGREELLGQGGFLGRMQEAAAGGDRESVVRIFEEMVEQIRQAENGLAGVSQEGRNLVAQMYQASLATAETNALLNGSAAEAAKLREQAERNAEAYEELIELAREFQDTQLSVSSDLYQRLSSLRQETDLQKEIARYGSESAQVAELRAAQEREAVRLEAMKAGHFNESLKAIMDQYDATVLATEQADKTTAALEELAGLNLGSLRAEIDFLIRRLNIGEEAARAMALAMPIGRSGGDAARGGRGMTLNMGGRRPNFDMDLGIGRYADKPGRGGGGAAPGIGGFAQSLLTEMEQIELFRENALEQLESFNSLELDLLGGHTEAKLRIEEEYQNRLDALRKESRQQTLSETSSLFGALANIASVGGQKTVKAVATFQAIEGTINAYGAAIKALNTPGIGLAGRFAAYASVLAAGLKGVAAIRSAGGVGGGGGGAASVAPIPAAASAAPQRVVIEGIDRDSLISGEQLSRLFDRLYEENNERGVVFSVAR